MKYPFIGLYYYCLHLAEHLAETSTNKEFCVYIRKQNSSLFPGICKMVLQPWHKLLFPSLKKYAVWHSTYQGSKYFPTNKKIKIVLTIHDLNFLYDEKKAAWKKERNLKELSKKIDRADHIVAISDYVLEDIKKNINLKGKACSVIYNGCNITELPHLQTPNLKPEQPFLFTIGAIVDKKNFHVLPSLLVGTAYRLVIAGVTNSEEYKQKILQEALSLGVADRLVFTGPVSENDKQWYLKNCTAFVFPSISEGFGLPVVEAMYFGKPVLLSTHTSLPEIGGPVAYYFQNFQPDHMRNVLKDALLDYEQHNREVAIKERAAFFSWQNAALSYQKVYESLL